MEKLSNDRISFIVLTLHKKIIDGSSAYGDAFEDLSYMLASGVLRFHETSVLDLHLATFEKSALRLQSLDILRDQIFRTLISRSANTKNNVLIGIILIMLFGEVRGEAGFLDPVECGEAKPEVSMPSVLTTTIVDNDSRFCSIIILFFTHSFLPASALICSAFNYYLNLEQVGEYHNATLFWRNGDEA